MKTSRTLGSKPAVARAKATRSSIKKDLEPLVEFDGTKVGREYSQDDTYKVGERLEHATFGRGVVELIAGPRKIQVWFEPRESIASPRRTLVHSRSGTVSDRSSKPLLERRRAASSTHAG